MRIKDAWLIKVSLTIVSTIHEAQLAFNHLSDNGTTSAVLLFSHPKI
jgi:hypothetical protein